MTQKTSYEQIKDDISENGPVFIGVILILIRSIFYLAAPFLLIAFFAWLTVGDGLLNSLLIFFPR